MKLVFKLFFIFIAHQAFSQNINTQPPVLSPQTPTTSDLGKYGEVQVNESTGIISPSIPLFDFNTGGLPIPVALSYSGNGVRVNQDPTWVGINWNLNPGGVITRTVRDRIDEQTSTSNRKYYSEEELNALPGAKQLYPNSINIDMGTQWAQTIQSFYSPAIDTEADIFNYSFMGYSGSFYLDQNNIVHLIKYDKELEIVFEPSSGLPQTANNKSGFIIRTPEGHTFYFGGSTASESSKVFVNNGAGSTSSSDFAQNAFYLHKINFITGGEVTFQYENYKSTPCDYVKMGTQVSLSVAPLSPSTKTEKILYSWIENALRLKKISSTLNDQYVEFDTSPYGQCNRMTKLNHVYLKDKNDAVIKKITMNYLSHNIEDIASENKFFLQKVDFYGKNNSFIYDYELTYNLPTGLPKKSSFSQDDLGFFNGKENTTLLPKTGNPLLDFNGATADREADFNSCSKGTLTMIKYPTGGYTRFEYELPYKGQVHAIQDHYMSAFYRHPMSNYTSSYYEFKNNMHTYSKTYLPDEGDGPLDLTETATFSMQLHIESFGSNTHHNNVLITIEKLQGGQSIPVWTNDPSGNNGNIGYKLTTTDNELKTYDTDYSVTLPPGSYIFRMSVNLLNFGPTTQTNNYVVANLKLDLPIGKRNVYHPGLRIRNVINGDGSGNEYKTRYYYSHLYALASESYNLSVNYITITNGHYYNDTDHSGPLINYLHLTTNSVKNSFNRDQGTFVYPIVTVSYGGDGFPNGGKELTFINNTNYPPLVYPLNITGDSFLTSNDAATFVDAGTNDSYASSVLQQEKFFDKNRKVLKTNQYNYEGTPDHEMNNIIMYQKTDRGWGGSNPFIDDYVPLLYKTRSYKYRLKSITSTDYLPDTGNNVTTVTNNSYRDDMVSLPSTIETTTSTGENKLMKLFYPPDIDSEGFPDLSADDQNLIPQLKIRHNISQIVREESFLGGQPIETKQISFKNWNGKILPAFVKASKGGKPLENRVVFEEYSTWGRPALVSLEGGIKTKYIYNSKQQLILKLENFTGQYTIDDSVPINTLCYYQNQYPNCMVTTYAYDDVTNNLTSITNPNCETIYYEYDFSGRLERTKDQRGNVISENKYNYRP